MAVVESKGTDPSAKLPRVFESPGINILTTFVVSLIVALVLTWFIAPLPKVHDEFSYLLAADGLSNFKTSAETHPHWKHFETYHVIHQPRYASKYPPGQASILALGIWMGHPMFAICFLTAASTAALFWMACAWLPKEWHFFAVIVLATHPGIQILWGQTYMGGTLAMMGGALLTGAWGYIRRDNCWDIKLGALAGLGISLLMFSRPMEGSVLTISVGVGILANFLGNPTENLRPFLLRFAAPLSVIVLGSLLILCKYNQSVTGSSTHLPYQVYEKTNGWVPLFLWQYPDIQQPHYQNEMVANFYYHDYQKRVNNFRSWSSTFGEKMKTALEAEYFFFGSSLVVGLLMVPFFIGNRQFLSLASIGAPALIAGFATPWGHPHYLAPVGCVLLTLGLLGLSHIWTLKLSETIKRIILVFILVAHCLWFGKELVTIKYKYSGSWWVHREAIRRQLEESPQKDLVFVEYGPTHSFYQEWVYNDMDIDNSEVIWARVRSNGENNELISYFSDRKIWKIEPDLDLPRLSGIHPEKRNSKFVKTQP